MRLASLQREYPSSSRCHYQIQLKAFPPAESVLGEEGGVCVCLYWGVGGGGLEWEKGGEGVGGEDKRALSALLILYFSSGGCGAFPASCSVGCLHSLRETDRCHANTHTLTLADCHFPSRPHTTHICRQLYVCIHTNTHTHKQKGTVALSYKYSAVFFCRTYPSSHIQAHKHRKWLLGAISPLDRQLIITL